MLTSLEWTNILLRAELRLTCYLRINTTIRHSEPDLKEYDKRDGEDAMDETPTQSP